MAKEFKYHVPLPEEIHTIERLYDQLCSAAAERGAKEKVLAVYPSACVNCSSVCAYGLSLLDALQSNQPLPKLENA